MVELKKVDKYIINTDYIAPCDTVSSIRVNNMPTDPYRNT